jgi:hypothetical protein
VNNLARRWILIKKLSVGVNFCEKNQGRHVLANSRIFGRFFGVPKPAPGLAARMFPAILCKRHVIKISGQDGESAVDRSSRTFLGEGRLSSVFGLLIGGRYAHKPVAKNQHWAR